MTEVKTLEKVCGTCKSWTAEFDDVGRGFCYEEGMLEPPTPKMHEANQPACKSYENNPEKPKFLDSKPCPRDAYFGLDI